MLISHCINTIVNIFPSLITHSSHFILHLDLIATVTMHSEASNWIKIIICVGHCFHDTTQGVRTNITVGNIERYVKIMLNYTNMSLLEIFEKYFEGFVHYLKGILKTGKMLKLFKILS